MAIKESNVRRLITLDREFYYEALEYVRRKNTTLSKEFFRLLEKEIQNDIKGAGKYE